MRIAEKTEDLMLPFMNEVAKKCLTSDTYRAKEQATLLHGWILADQKVHW